ncbi:MAG TPA: zf-HC2 domain-containing protein [Pyrinomonadaceae bacterium]|nr:zf-HC2 domain-containing protein [Pyrinomonadaceae bacterium]
MKCKDVQKLLPLYVGSDLKEKRAKLVTAHVRCCADCAASADEYRASRQLLMEFAPPAFSEAVYTGMRQNVLREIARESTAPALPQVVASWFSPRIGWAVATALLLVVSVLAFYFIAGRNNDLQKLADSHGTLDGNGKAEQPDVKPQNEYLGRPQKPHRHGTVGSRPAIARNPRKSGLSLGSERERPSGKSEASLAPSSAEPALGAPTTSEKTLRVEMQTKDPNIRIIWFTTERIRRDSPRERSKGI